MAEVFVGERMAGGDGPRTVALKRVLPHLQDDPEMVGMLKDEIALGLACRHPNVIATLDSFEHMGELYAVLEYVDGLDLTNASAGLLERGERYTRAEAVQVCMELCKGLGHLHGLTDGGAPLSVVHRDVTPPNVLLGVDGAVKLCDFGFAKSKMQRTLTAPGLVKGKFSYLSPEAALGEKVDARADVFAVGILLWEMLAMHRLFDAPTDYETVQRVQETHIPPLAPLVDEHDEVIEEIVRRALARDPGARFQTAAALHDALAAYADWQELDCDIGGLVRRVRGPRVHESGPVPAHR